MLGVSTGGRISELLSLTIDDVYQNQHLCNPKIRSDVSMDENAQERTLKILHSAAENWVKPDDPKSLITDCRLPFLPTTIP